MLKKLDQKTLNKTHQNAFKMPLKIFGSAFYKPSEAQCSAEQSEAKPSKAQCSAEQSEAKLLMGRDEVTTIAKQWLVGTKSLLLRSNGW